MYQGPDSGTGEYWSAFYTIFFSFPTKLLGFYPRLCQNAASLMWKETHHEEHEEKNIYMRLWQNSSIPFP
jgi:hypothetical protein